MSQADTRGKSILGKRKSKCEGPELGAWLCVEGSPRWHKWLQQIKIAAQIGNLDSVHMRPHRPW